MKYKTAFRLALKVIGVWLVFQSLPWAVTGAVHAVGAYLESQNRSVVFGSSFLFFQLGQLLMGLVGVAGGVYLFFGGRWIVDRAIPSNRPYCHECGYQLSGLKGTDGICPECGTPYRNSGWQPPLQS